MALPIHGSTNLSGMATPSRTPTTRLPWAAAARLLTLHCPILVLIAVTIIRGSAETFAFQSPFGNSGTEAADRALFTTLLSGISFRS